MNETILKKSCVWGVEISILIPIYNIGVLVVSPNEPKKLSLNAPPYWGA